VKAVVLTYHSHRIQGPDYARNDHVAFAADLQTIDRSDARIVSLATLVDTIASYQSGHAGAEHDAMVVALTFDDGPVWDYVDFDHPDFGPQRGFANAMRDFLVEVTGRGRHDVCATSFVIASPEARHAMESTFDAEYTFLLPGAMNDDWWREAAASGLIGIGNHSWDHLHPALASVAHSRQVRGDFTQVATAADADAQIRAAAAYIDTHTGGRAAPFFAYPYGHCNDFLAADYLPHAGRAMGLRAAFTTAAQVIDGSQDVWKLPRFTCGHHWRSPDALADLLAVR
jgi:hypothetical protein